MGCFHPLRAFRQKSGAVVLGREPPDAAPLSLPCGGCLGCRMDNARAWALRCHLELQSHPTAVFSTLTYAPDRLPPTLQKSHLQLWLKRLRKRAPNRVRFFACGEYGEQTARPHYHAILYGLGESDAALVEDTWALGHCRTVAVTPAAISYVAGYSAKKLGWKLQVKEHVDYDTGEVYTWQPPFIQMSRRPGIGGEARQWAESWRLYGVHNGSRMPVPRYLHQAWKDCASDSQLEDLLYEKSLLSYLRDKSPERLQAAEQIAVAKQGLKAARRTL